MHTWSDEPTCVIQMVPMTCVLVLLATSLSMDCCRCIASSGSTSTTYGLTHRCILIADDHILDFVVDYPSVRLARMVFITLFEFFVFFEHCCRCHGRTRG